MRFSIFLVFLVIHGSMCSSLHHPQHKKPIHHQESDKPHQDESLSHETKSDSQRHEKNSESLSQEASDDTSLLSHEPPAQVHHPLNHESFSEGTGQEEQLFSKIKNIKNQANASSLYAFSATLSADRAVSEDTIIVFGKVLTNVGGLYVNNSGLFVCPDDGLYVFVWSIQKSDSTGFTDMRCATGLRQGNNSKKYGPKTSYLSTVPSGSTEMMTVLQCQQLTTVAIINKAWSDTPQLSLFERKSSFSGFKLHSSIAFTAELSSDQYQFPGNKVTFDNELADFGNNYIQFHGYFLCPDRAVYVFSVSASTTDPLTPWSGSRLMKEGQVIVNGPITYIATATHDSGSNSITAVVVCSTGHSVYVETTQADHGFPYNSYAPPQLTSFTGFKLYDTSDTKAKAFTAVMPSDFTGSGENLTLPIDTVIFNIGNAFDRDEYGFICPDDDYYMFTFSATANYGMAGNSSVVALYKEETEMTRLSLSPQTVDPLTGNTGSSSHSAILQCTSSNRFPLRLLEASDMVFLGDYTIFSAYKIPGDI